MDRVGRMLDPWVFRHLRLPKSAFSDDMLTTLVEEASQSIRVVGDEVVLDHAVLQRRVKPLNIFLRETSDPAVREQVILDYGQLIKDLAAAGVMGEYTSKNLGVTAGLRVVLYDFDDLRWIETLNFRTIPEPALEEATWMEDEGDPRYYVGPNDVFPEEMRTWAGIPPDLMETFESAHGETFSVEYWVRMQKRFREARESDDLPDFFPYAPGERLRLNGEVAADPETAGQGDPRGDEGDGASNPVVEDSVEGLADDVRGGLQSSREAKDRSA